MHAPPITCLNGRFLAAEAAMLPVADRGFRFGDGVFETIRLCAGVPYQWELHLSRFDAGLQALRIAAPGVDWQAIARQLIAKNGAREGFIRLAISRGVGSQGYLPLQNITANWVMEYLPPTANACEPAQLWQSTITRPALTALPANHKLAHGIGSTLALLDARDQHCDEALMLSHEGHIGEASSGNIFWVTEGVLFTPALATGCIAGTTRACVMRLCADKVHEVMQDMQALSRAQAVFITNVRRGIWPVSALQPVGMRFATDHPLVASLAAKLDADRDAYTAQHAKAWA